MRPWGLRGATQRVLRARRGQPWQAGQGLGTASWVPCGALARPHKHKVRGVTRDADRDLTTRERGVYGMGWYSRQGPAGPGGVKERRACRV